MTAVLSWLRDRAHRLLARPIWTRGGKEWGQW